MVRYRESLTPSWPFHIALLVLLPMGFGMLAPINIIAGYISAATFYLLALVVFVGFAPRLVVTDTEFRAGRATIERRFLGETTIVERSERASAIADARTWKVIRGWVPTGLSIVVNDKNDPTPSWYVSTRHPEKLRAALASR